MNSDIRFQKFARNISTVSQFLRSILSLDVASLYFTFHFLTILIIVYNTT
jgi:hypothetical protein